MFLEAQFTIAKIWKQPKCPSTDDWIEKMCYIYTMEYYSVIKEWNLSMCNNTNGPRGLYDKWRKSEKDEDCVSLICEISKTKQMNKHNKAK